MTTTVDRYPRLGETVIGKQFSQNFGGKGANQAVAAARLGGQVQLVGCVGEDDLGLRYLNYLRGENVGIDHVKPVTHAPTGTSSILVAGSDNLIVVVPGANYELTPADINAAASLIRSSQIVILQLEIPMETVARTLEIASGAGVTTILNPAPYQSFPSDWLDKVTYFTPNEHEAEMLVKMPGFQARHKEKLIITMGKRGVVYFEGGKEVRIDAPNVQAVDTTGAGDTFNGALGCFLDRGYAFRDACRHAVFAASLSVTKPGAQGGMPTLEELRAFMNNSL